MVVRFLRIGSNLETRLVNGTQDFGIPRGEGADTEDEPEGHLGSYHSLEACQVFLARVGILDPAAKDSPITAFKALARDDSHEGAGDLERIKGGGGIKGVPSLPFI
jgi:hypothetical protein